MKRFNSFEDIPFAETDAIEWREEASEYDGKCLHCEYYHPFRSNPDSGQCVLNGNICSTCAKESCARYTPNKPESNPWYFEPEWFEQFIKRRGNNCPWVFQFIKSSISRKERIAEIKKVVYKGAVFGSVKNG